MKEDYSEEPESTITQEDMRSYAFKGGMAGAMVPPTAAAGAAVYAALNPEEMEMASLAAHAMASQPAMIATGVTGMAVGAMAVAI